MKLGSTFLEPGLTAEATAEVTNKTALSVFSNKPIHAKGLVVSRNNHVSPRDKIFSGHSLSVNRKISLTVGSHPARHFNFLTA